MAARRKAGLTAGQLLTLTFGFTLASVIIFVFGLWVGRDLAQQRQKQERPVVRAQVEGGVPAKGAVIAPVPTSTARAETARASARPTRPRLHNPTAVSTRTTAATRTSTRRPPAPSTPRPAPTARRAPAKNTRRAVKPTPVRQARPTVASREMWTVQALATNDQVQALVQARGLRSKGFDAFTSQADVGGVTWYRIQVGKFSSKREADAMVGRLRREGVEAAFAERLR